MPPKKERVDAIIAYFLIHGTEKTLEHFNVTHEYLGRVKRLYRQFEGKDAPQLREVDLLKKIAARFTSSELKALAEGGRIIPGQDKVPVVDFSGERVKFLLITDTHIGSIFFKEDYLTAAFVEGEKAGCDFLVHCGDVTEGMSKRDGHIYELSHLGYDKQRDYAVELFSKWRKPMYMIDGNHDRWYKKENGALVVKDICACLKNAEYLGHDVGDISLKGKALLRLWHGEDSSSYSVSYRLQKIIEAFSGGDKPNILCAGHTHKQAYIFERHVHCFSGGAISSQSSWMKSKRMANHTGFWTIEATIGKSGGISKIGSMWYPFYA